MKVKIGKYPSRLVCNIHTNYMDRKYGYVNWLKEREWAKSDKFMEKLEDVIQAVYDPINWLLFNRSKQKVKVRIDPWDTWSMDSTLQPIILPMLKQLKETKHGAPFVDYDDVPEHLHPGQEEIDATKDGRTDEHWFERWDWVMDEMIFAFESVDSDWEEQFYSGEIDYASTPVDYAGNEVDREDADLFRMDKGPNDTFELDLDNMKIYQARISNGFRLFGKYFQALWD